MGNFAPCCSSTPGTAVCLRKRSNIIHPAQRSESSFRSLTPVKKVQRTLSRSSFRRMSSLRIFTRKTESTTSDISVLGDNGKASILVTIDHQILSKYTVHTLLGRGSFSSVLKITSKNSNMEFAMKVIEKKMGERIVTWETELAVLKRVRHPHILYLHEVILTRRQAYFILQLATGGDLASKIVSVGSLGEHTSRELVVMILSALVYMHHHGITHRDLKLENCLFLTEQPDSSLVVSDFGLAHITVDGKPSEAGMDATCGTAEYMSPEMLEGELYSSLVDLWALGIIVFAMVSGELPFKDQNRTQLHEKIMNGLYSLESEAWNGVSDDAKTFIEGLLCVDVSQRLTAKSALNHSWLVPGSLAFH